MRFAIFSFLLALLATYAVAVAPILKPVIVSYSDDTPDDIVKSAKQAILDAKGIITHEYSIFKGFAAKAPESILQTVKTLGTDYKVYIEADGIVRTNDE
ncbi:hypothetical protein B0J11DRAFT_583351 [Dendryphion nanum]|uniref:Uncharacterized protein n=1 Tax=Dendryphion nanum TaxID=256645 RepID=A0A9P9DCK3_9PLEO|nr:hypothetical protein B0J11DRAFT_583351 [Dendryphion nanum]